MIHGPWEERWSRDRRIESWVSWVFCSAWTFPCHAPTDRVHQHGLRHDGTPSILWRFPPTLRSADEVAELMQREREEAVESEEEAFADRVSVERFLTERAEFIGLLTRGASDG